ncbi:hypothetical protein PsorP6_011249 [Peronosclerospora sorghi]|uniref:Uncharacterized protein n=1 Tax=Peronosclerospora sorghi TaxID=230839 RepID=A0ACC0WI15_9STRA|nr:hypothetical protein PsorP6_011249 [Peronosclerospora sorghi]
MAASAFSKTASMGYESSTRDKKTAATESKHKHNYTNKVSPKPGTPTPADLKEGKEVSDPSAKDERSDVRDNAVIAASDIDDDNGSITPASDSSG